MPNRAAIQRGGSSLFRLEMASILSVSFCVIGLDVSHILGRAKAIKVWNFPDSSGNNNFDVDSLGSRDPQSKSRYKQDIHKNEERSCKSNL